jgi:hypothetical protein
MFVEDGYNSGWSVSFDVAAVAAAFALRKAAIQLLWAVVAVHTAIVNIVDVISAIMGSCRCAYSY